MIRKSKLLICMLSMCMILAAAPGMESSAEELAGEQQPAAAELQDENSQRLETVTGMDENGGIFTPPVTAGLLNGIIRQYLLSKYKITETSMTMGALSKFDECFITNSLMGIMPVRSLGEKTFSHFIYCNNKQWYI